jgi:hypothetical protein
MIRGDIPLSGSMGITCLSLTLAAGFGKHLEGWSSGSFSVYIIPKMYKHKSYDISVLPLKNLLIEGSYMVPGDASCLPPARSLPL